VATTSQAQSAAAGPTTGAIRFGPGLMTLPEIAEKLSTAGQPVRCAPGLRHRAAFVYLKERPRAQAESILAAALDVRVRPSTAPEERKQGVLVLDSDPDAEQRERRWRRRLADALHTTVAERVREMAAHLQRPRAEVVAEREKATAERQALQDRKRTPAEEARLRAVQRNEMALTNAENSDPFQLAARACLPPQFTAREIERALETGYTLRVDAATAVLSDADLQAVEGFAKQRFFREASEPPRFGHLVSGWTASRDLGQVGISFATSLLAPVPGGDVHCNPWEVGTRYPSFVPPSDDESGGAVQRAILDEMFLRGEFGGANGAVLGEGAAGWLRAERRSTEAFLASERARKPISAVPGGTVEGDSVSEVVARWSARQDAEAVMELWPPVERRMRNADTLAGTFAVTDPWTLEEKDGVLLVRNQMAFLDRPRRTPTAALAGLLRTVEATNGPRATLPPARLPYEAMVAYCDASQDTTPWAVPESPSGTYHGLRLYTLDNAAPGLFVWRRMTFGQRRELMEGTPFPLRELPGAALADLAGMLRRRFGPNKPALWQPGVDAQLAAGEMRPDLSLRSGRSSWLRLDDLNTGDWSPAVAGNAPQAR
jgi:hypothetical protein